MSFHFRIQIPSLFYFSSTVNRISANTTTTKQFELNVKKKKHDTGSWRHFNCLFIIHTPLYCPLFHKHEVSREENDSSNRASGWRRSWAYETVYGYYQFPIVLPAKLQERNGVNGHRKSGYNPFDLL
ncbi:hypothetical protein BKA69DRAFT_1102828 [Paraphysoderma sedebokerense]|nr:hypothetical protein BKA69DRAFT_1102828 [Paraphysoderma sedebokerense]